MDSKSFGDDVYNNPPNTTGKKPGEMNGFDDYGDYGDYYGDNYGDYGFDDRDRYYDDFSFSDYDDYGFKEEKSITERAEEFLANGAAKQGGDAFKQNFFTEDDEYGYEEEVKAFDYRDWVGEDVFEPPLSRREDEVDEYSETYAIYGDDYGCDAACEAERNRQIFEEVRNTHAQRTVTLDFGEDDYDDEYYEDDYYGELRASERCLQSYFSMNPIINESKLSDP